MSFNKFTTFKVENDDVEVLDGNLLKTAAMKLPDGFTYDPDYLYLKVKAVSAGEFWGDNKNNDYFPEIELIKHHKTFLAAHTFKNHENKKIENAIGDVLSAEWSDKMKCVYLIIRIDRRVSPTIVRGYEKGFMTDVSMGCRVDHVICSYCGQKAKTRFDYCDHLKTMKGRIMENGKKVCEINIGPKFHDISAVLNGAERTAKVEGLYIHGDKVAFEQGESFEKTASFKDSFSNTDFFKTATEHHREELNMEVIASSFEKKKEQSPKDVDTAKEELQNKVVGNALDDMAKKNLDSLEDVVNIIKAKYTKYWDKSMCTGIGRSLRDIAKSNGVDPAKVFAQFLKVLDVAAIELSPLEMHDIFFETMNFDSHDLRSMKLNGGSKIVDNSDKITNSLNVKGVPTAIKVITSLRDMCETEGFESLQEKPTAKIKAVIIKSTPRIDHTRDIGGIGEEIMSKIVSGLLESRSNHRGFLIPRLSKIASGDIAPSDNSAHFAPMILSKMEKVASAEDLVIPAIMSSVLYSAYQNERVDRLNSGELNDGIKKMAFLMDDSFSLEKTASKKMVSPVGAIATGIPLMFSYSALQRSRINNGEQISSINRFIAENPANAAFLSSFLTAMGAKKINKHAPKILNGAKNMAKTLAKQANEEYNMFKDDFIDSAMTDKGYDNESIKTIKLASMLTGMGKEDVAEQMLVNNDLCCSDMEEYLKTASSCFTIEIEKNASNLAKAVSRSVLGDIVMQNTKKGSVAASIPGYILDGIVLAGIGKGLSNVTKNVERREN